MMRTKQPQTGLYAVLRVVGEAVEVKKVDCISVLCRAYASTPPDY